MKHLLLLTNNCVLNKLPLNPYTISLKRHIYGVSFCLLVIIIIDTLIVVLKNSSNNNSFKLTTIVLLTEFDSLKMLLKFIVDLHTMQPNHKYITHRHNNNCKELICEKY